MKNPSHRNSLDNFETKKVRNEIVVDNLTTPTLKQLAIFTQHIFCFWSNKFESEFFEFNWAGFFSTEIIWARLETSLILIEFLVTSFLKSTILRNRKQRNHSRKIPQLSVVRIGGVSVQYWMKVGKTVLMHCCVMKQNFVVVKIFVNDNARRLSPPRGKV